MVYLTFNGKFISYQGGLMVSSVNSFPAPDPPPTPPTDPEWSGITVSSNLEAYFDSTASDSYPGTGTTWFDRTVNNNDLTLTNGPTLTADPSIYFSSFDFDGTDDYATGGDVLDWGTGDITIAAWICTNTLAGGIDWVVSKKDPSSDSTASQWGFGINNDDIYFYCVTNDAGDGQMTWTGTTAIPQDTWKFIAMTTNRANSQVNFYLDGSPIGESANGNAADLDRTEGDNINSSHPFMIGGEDTARPDRLFNGLIAEVHFHSSRLSDADVLANYNATKGKYQ